MYLKIIAALLIALLGTGCAVQSRIAPNKLQHTQNFSADYQLPLDVTAVVFVSAEEFKKTTKVHNGFNVFSIKSGEELKKSTESLFSHYFANGGLLSSDQQPHLVYLLKPSSVTVNTFWGSYKVSINGEVFDYEGNKIYTGSANATEVSGMINDAKAIHNAYMKAASQFLDKSLLSLGSQRLRDLATAQPPTVTQKSMPFIYENLSLIGSGSGFFINESGQALTSYHVVNQCISIEVHHKNKQLPARIVEVDKFLDLAVIEIEGPSRHYVKFLPEDQKAKLGQQIIVAGYPLSQLLGNSVNVTLGNISSINGINGEKNSFQLSAPIQPGNSGGPVVGRPGAVVGIINSTLNSVAMVKNTGSIPQNVNFAIKAGLATQLLEQRNIKYYKLSTTENSKQSLDVLTEDVTEYTVQVVCKG